MFEQPKTKIQICALFGCISDSLQPLAVHSHQLLCVQPNDSGKRNTAKSCTEYSQFICSVSMHINDTFLIYRCIMTTKTIEILWKNKEHY